MTDKIQAQLDSVFGLRPPMLRDSVVSFAGSINTKQAYKKFCKGLFNIGVTAEMLSQKEGEIQAIFKPQHPAASSQTDDSTFVDSNQLPEVGSSSVGTSPISTISAENPGPRSMFGWVRPPIDFLVAPLMLAAAEAGNTKRLISTLEYVQNINFADDLKETVLHKAVGKGHQDMVQLLLQKGASAEAMNSFNDTPLDVAARNGYTNIMELLLMNGASGKSMDEDNSALLHRAASSGHTSTVELLLSKGASIEAMNKYNMTPLHLTASGGHTCTVELLLSKGASIGAMGKHNITPLHFAASVVILIQSSYFCQKEHQ